MTTSFVGRRVPAGTLRVQRQPLRLPLLLLLVWWLVKHAWRLLLAVAGSPVLVATLAAMVLTWAVCQLTHPLVPFFGLVLLAGVLVFVRHRWPDGFQRWAYLPLLARWRGFSIYRHKWRSTMDFAGLNGLRRDGSQFEPVLLSVKSTPHVDRLRVRMLAGQVVDDWGRVSDRLCQTFGSIDTRVRSVPSHPHEVECWFLTSDPLQQVVEPFQPELPVNLAALPVALREDGEVYRLPLLGNHILVAGKTGAGKSSGEWAIIHALAPCIADGTVQLLGIDPKADELSFGEPLFARLAYRDPADYAAVLEDAVTIMRARQIAQRGVTRLHTPTRDEPLIVVVVDELSSLSYITDREIKRRIESALGLLLSQGRAVGISVVGCVQDPRKETVPARGLYTVRVLLAVNEEDEVALLLGRGARDRGARADKIPANLQGVAFVEVDGQAEPIRVRFAYIDDDHIRTLCGGWRPDTFDAVPAEVMLTELGGDAA
jgi:DNA segregation ATPase FtsK/SpoIIIE, S-DNA-T family